MAERNEKFNNKRGEKREDNTPHRLIAINRVTMLSKADAECVSPLSWS